MLEQLEKLASAGGGAGRAAAGLGSGEVGGEVVRVDDWLKWLVEAYIDSKKNASALFETLYDRYDRGVVRKKGICREGRTYNQ